MSKANKAHRGNDEEEKKMENIVPVIEKEEEPVKFESRTGIYICADKEQDNPYAKEMPPVALRFIYKDRYFPTHLVVDEVIYETTTSNIRADIQNMHDAAKNAVDLARDSIIVMEQAHKESIIMLKTIYADYDDEIDWLVNFRRFLDTLSAPETV